MKGLDTGKDKVKKICDVLRKDTLEPARMEAEEIVKQAEQTARKMIEEAQKQIEILHSDAAKKIEKEKNVFQSSLNLSCKQALERLKQEIETNLFDAELCRFLHPAMEEPKVLSELISAVVNALEKEGTEADLTVVIPKNVPAEKITQMLAEKVLHKLKSQNVVLESISGGISVQLHKQQVTIDLTEEALKGLVAQYIRKDFRQILFGS